MKLRIVNDASVEKKSLLLRIVLKWETRSKKNFFAVVFKHSEYSIRTMRNASSFF
jgi:hypothetical protein